jgi:hypothetical protein
MVRIRRVSQTLWLGFFPFLAVPRLASALLGGLSVDPGSLALAMMAFWVVAVVVFFAAFMRCPRCNHSLCNTKAKAEWSEHARTTAQCPSCGLSISDAL